VAAPHLGSITIRMTITFENDNDVIVYALERIIVYARRTQQIFVAQYNIQSRNLREVTTTPRDIQEGLRNRETSNIVHPGREVSTTPRDTQEDLRNRATLNNVYPSRQAQVQDSDDILSSSDIAEIRQEETAKETEKFIALSRKERKEFIKQKQSNLLINRSGRSIKPITKKQRNYLQSISKDTIAEYLKNRK
jgi:phosphate starvation-inducible protein PhoH